MLTASLRRIFYHYCMNNPVMYSDKSGRDPFDEYVYDGDIAADFAQENYDRMADWSDRFYYEANANCARFSSACVFMGFNDESMNIVEWHDNHYLKENDVTQSWRLAKQQCEFFSKSSITIKTVQFSGSANLSNILDEHDIMRGDLAYQVIHTDKGDKWHSVIITKVSDEMIYYTGNSKNRKDAEFTRMMYSDEGEVEIIILMLKNRRRQND